MNENIKTNCVGSDCFNSLPGTESYYNMNGNFCQDCCAEINRKLEEGKTFRQELVNKKVLSD